MTNENTITIERRYPMADVVSYNGEFTKEEKQIVKNYLYCNYWFIYDLPMTTLEANQLGDNPVLTKEQVFSAISYRAEKNARIDWNRVSPNALSADGPIEVCDMYGVD